MKTCFALLVVCLYYGGFAQAPAVVYETKTLKILRLDEGVYQHISYLMGSIACNGMVLADRGEALVFDTPAGDADTAELLDWITMELHCQTVGVVVNHFHTDCLGGLAEFHRRGIASYASEQTVDLARADSVELPKYAFAQSKTLKAGKIKVINSYFGEAHTRDNIVSYVPAKQTLFGGCMIKAMDAPYGNLADANTHTWSQTVTDIRSKYSELNWVIPGHGDAGGAELLDYTIRLFQDKAAE